MKTYDITLQHIVSYRLRVKARSADAAEQTALDRFGETDAGFKEIFSAVEVLSIEKAVR